MFNQPTNETNGLWFKPAQHKDHLVLFETVIDGGTEFDQMSGKDREYRNVKFYDLDGEAVLLEAKVTHAGIVKKLAVGSGMILGRVEQVKTSNGYLAWVLSAFTPKDAEQAKAWIDAGKPSKVDPFAQIERDAENAGVTPEMLAALKRLTGGEEKVQF